MMISGTREPGASAEIPETDFASSIGDLLQPIWQRLWIIVLSVVLCTGMAVGFSLAQAPVYEASIKILVGQKQGFIADPAEAASLQDLSLTVTEAVATRPVVQPAIEELNLETTTEEVIENISVESVADTQFIEVTYRDTNPQRAQQVVNAIGDELSDQVSEVSSDVNAMTAIVWEEALGPESPVSPNPLANGVLAAVIGGMLGVGLVFLLDYLDTSWRSPEEAERVTGVPSFGVIPKFQGRNGRGREGEHAVQTVARR